MTSIFFESLLILAKFSNQPSPSVVWLEGTGRLAAALLTLSLPRNLDIDGFDGDVDTARIPTDVNLFRL
jgi:hypothetical protein